MRVGAEKAAEVRARARVIETLLAEYNRMLDHEDVKQEPGKTLDRVKKEIQNGYLGNAAYGTGERRLAEIWKEARESVDKAPDLSFSDLTHFSGWFSLRPDRVAGTEATTSSREFPVTIKGGMADVERAFEGIWNKPKEGSTEMGTSERIARLTERLRRLDTRSLSGFPLLGLDGLGELAPPVARAAGHGIENIRKAVEKGRQEEAGEKDKVLSFDEVVEQYNSGISRGEIQAWVWYRRTLGVPMTGWEDYFLSGSGEAVTHITSTTRATVYDQVFRELRTVPAGFRLGKYTGKKHQYDGETYLIFRNDEGLRICRESQVSLSRDMAGFASPEEIHSLVLEGALYYLNGEYLPFPVYAYGNMYDRTLQLQEDREAIIEQFGEETYRRHREVIETAKPRPLSIQNPDPNERPRISALSQFAADFKISRLRDELNLYMNKEASLFEVFRSYVRVIDKAEFRNTEPDHIIKYFLDGKKVMDKGLTQDQRVELRAHAQNEGEEQFAKFLHDALDIDDQQKVDMLWNRLYNGQSNLPYHRVPIGFRASARFKGFPLELRPAQREGIAFINSVGSGILAYDVGVGKTLTAIVTLADAIVAGKAKRPLIVVPNPTYAKWIGEVIGYTDRNGKFVPGVLSHTGVEVNEWYNLGTDILRSIDIRKKVKEGTITIVTYEGFRRIGFSEKVMDEMVVELSNILGQSTGRVSQRDQEVKYQQYEAMIGVGIKDTVADIDTLGFDMLVIDEAHRCKNIFEGVKVDDRGRKQFGISGAVSETGVKAFFLCNFIQRRYGRNVILLTATPFTNSPLEIYSMLSLVAYDGMKAMGINGIGQFFELFVQESLELAVNMKEEITLQKVVKRFNNRVILQKLIYNHISYKTGEEAGIIRPCKVNLPRVNGTRDGKTIRLTPDEQILTYLRMTEEQRRLQRQVVAKVQVASLSNGKYRQALIFQALNESLDNALTPFLVNGLTPDDHIDFVTKSPKIEYTMRCIRSVKEWHEARGEPVSGQVIYINRAKGWFPLIKDYLEQEVGYKRDMKWGKKRMDEVEIITSEVPASRKEAIKEAFLEGVVKVIIGTATIREGIDLQKNATVLYNLYPDWNPTDIRQLEGRIWRQGNRFGYVRIVMPLVQDSMDTFVFQKLEEKTSRINDIWYRGERGNVLDLESLDPEEVKFALMTDVEALADMHLKKEKAEAERSLARLTSKLTVMEELRREIGKYRENRELVLQGIEQFRREMALLDSVKNPPSPEALEKMPQGERKEHEAIRKGWEKLTAFAEKAERDDREILAITRLILDFEPYRNIHGLYLYKSSFSKVRKAEKTVLADKGYTINSDFGEVVDGINSEIAQVSELLKKIDTQEYRMLVLSEVHRKKSALAIEGKTVEQRAEDFTRLNYLMSFRQEDVEPNTCAIPDPSKERKGTVYDFAKARMKMLQLKLKLLKIA